MEILYRALLLTLHVPTIMLPKKLQRKGNNTWLRALRNVGWLLPRRIKCSGLREYFYVGCLGNWKLCMNFYLVLLFAYELKAFDQLESILKVNWRTFCLTLLGSLRGSQWDRQPTWRWRLMRSKPSSFIRYITRAFARDFMHCQRGFASILSLDQEVIQCVESAFYFWSLVQKPASILCYSRRSRKGAVAREVFCIEWQERKKAVLSCWNLFVVTSCWAQWAPEATRPRLGQLKVFVLTTHLQKADAAANRRHAGRSTGIWNGSEVLLQRRRFHYNLCECGYVTMRGRVFAYDRRVSERESD